MPQKNNRRPVNTREYRLRVLFVSEGTVTEPRYITALGRRFEDVNFKRVKHSNHSDPLHLLQSMRQWSFENALGVNDFAWIICDFDSWNATQIERLISWANESNQHFLGISNPSFEYWILLHEHSGVGVHSAKTLEEKLKSSIPKYTKHLDGFTLTRENLTTACTRAEQRLKDNEGDFRRVPSTTMHQLINLLG
jgi:hypothetical protein